jgi:hypothetical protein
MMLAGSKKAIRGTEKETSVDGDGGRGWESLATRSCSGYRALCRETGMAFWSVR